MPPRDELKIRFLWSGIFGGGGGKPGVREETSGAKKSTQKSVSSRGAKLAMLAGCRYCGSLHRTHGSKMCMRMRVGVCVYIC